MPALALTDVLPDFGRRSSAAELRPVERPIVLAPSGPSEAEIAGRIEAATERAAEEITQRLTRIYEDTLEAERAQHAAETEALRAALGDQAGALIAARLGELETNLVAFASDAVARILGAVVGDALQRRSIERLVDAIRGAIGERESFRIEVRGPQSLFEPLAAAMGDKADALHFVETAGFDLSVAVDGSLFETRLGEWSAAMAEIVS